MLGFFIIGLCTIIVRPVI